jgi:hypothetical protein
MAYVGCLIGGIIYVLWLLSRFVRVHERIASALETAARKLGEDGKNI